MSLVELEEVRCNTCGSDRADVYYRGIDHRFTETPRDEFRMVKCQQCDLVYLNPRPTAQSLSLFYPESYYQFRKNQSSPVKQAHGLRGISQRIWLEWDRLKDEERVSVVATVSPLQGSLLDVGCATGLFLGQMKGQGWEIAGVEWNPDAAAHARETLAAPIHQGELEDAPWPPATFDVVTLWHVLEHLPDPCATIHQVARLLKPGGHVIVCVPNARAAEYRLLGRLDPNPVDMPRHLYHFSPSTLAALMDKVGLQPTWTKTFTWNATPRLTGCLQSPVSGWEPQGMLARSVRTAWLWGALVTGYTFSAIAAKIASAGPAFIMAAEKPHDVE